MKLTAVILSQYKSQASLSVAQHSLINTMQEIWRSGVLRVRMHSFCFHATDGDHVRCRAGQHDLRVLKLLYFDINVVKLCHFLNSPD